MSGLNLFVDSEEECPPGYVLARTINEAINIIANGEVAIVDLGKGIRHSFTFIKREYEVDCNETFDAVEKYIYLMDEDDRPEVRHH